MTGTMVRLPLRKKFAFLALYSSFRIVEQMFSIEISSKIIFILYVKILKGHHLRKTIRTKDTGVVTKTPGKTKLYSVS